MPDRGDRAPWACAGVFLAALIAYWPVLRGGFIWDDDAHVTKPVLRSLHGLWRIWFEMGATQQYYPVLHSAFWVEHRLWGDAPLGYHLLNVVLHATAACLFGLILRRFWKRDGAAWLAAFLFALHPVGVESVAWISEQKNTLSAVFYLLAAMTHLRWRETLVVKQVGLGGRARPLAPSALGVSPNERSGATAQPYLYFLALGLFVLALLSKSVTATLPAALLLILWWQHGRLSWKRDILPLLPWFVIGTVAGLFTAWVERKYIGAEGASFTLSLLQRCLLAGRVAWFYLAKLVWPGNLLFIYPHWTVDAAAGWQYLFPLAAVALILALWLLRRRTRGPLAGALFFLGTLFPALGFFNVYPFLFSYVADHFQYLASLGIIALAAAGWARWTQGAMAEDAAGRPRGRPGSLLVAIPVLCLLGGLTWRQSRLYGDPQTLYRATLERNPGAWIVDTSLGAALVEAGRVPEAISYYERALRLAPNYAQGYYDLGNALTIAGRFSEAIDCYGRALRLKPYYVDAYNNRGIALADAGRLYEAIVEYEKALQLQPDHVESHNNLANVLLRLHRPTEAMTHYQRALQLSPDLAEPHYGLGVALASARQLPEAIAQYERALQLKPDYFEAHANLAGALANTGQLPEAIAEYEAALRLKPDDAAVHYNLGLALRLVGRTEEAQAQFEDANRLNATP
jgi:tetratricopeptide (TPR) repeat protein